MLTSSALPREGCKQSISYALLKVNIMADFIVKAYTFSLSKLIIRLIVNDKIINLQNINNRPGRYLKS